MPGYGNPSRGGAGVDWEIVTELLRIAAPAGPGQPAQCVTYYITLPGGPISSRHTGRNGSVTLADSQNGAGTARCRVATHPTMNLITHASWKRAARALLALSAISSQLTAQTDTATPNRDLPVALETFTVTGSLIPQASTEPMAPVAIFTEADMRSTGATTVVQALRNLPSFVGNPGPTEFDSNGGNGGTAVSLRGLGSGQTLVLLDGKQTLQFSNIQLIPLEAVERIEVLRDGAGIIYGSAAIGGAVNVVLKKNFSGSVVNVYGGAATRSPGARETFQTSFATGAASRGTSVMVAGSFFRNRTIYASQRPNSAESDNRSRGGTNGGSPTFPTVIQVGGNPLILGPAGLPANGLPAASLYIPFDTNTFSSNQLFNFRQFSPSAPGQERSSLSVHFEQELAPGVTFYAQVLASKLTTSNGLAPAPFALDAEPGGPAVGSLSSFGPFNFRNVLGFDNGDFLRYRSIELGDRTNEQTFDDTHYTAGLRGRLAGSWKWDASLTVEREIFRQDDAGVPSLDILDAEIQAGRFNPFDHAFGKGTWTRGTDGVVFNWDNEKALRAAEVHARKFTATHDRQYNGTVNGTLFNLPAGEVGLAAGAEYIKQTVDHTVDDLYRTGGVLGLNTDDNSFAELKIPLVAEANERPYLHRLSVGVLARREKQTNSGLDAASGSVASRDYQKTNPSVNLQFAPTENTLFRATWAKGFLAPNLANVFGATGTNNPTIVDPLGFPTTAQTTIVVRTNPNLRAAESKALSVGFVATPKGLVKNLTFSVDFYRIQVEGIVANNAATILALNAAGQGAGFKPGDATTINPNAPFAALIRRSANGRLNSNGSFATAFGVNSRGAVLSDFLNIAGNDVEGMEYTIGYTHNAADWGRFKFTLGANQFLRFEQDKGPGLPTVDYVGRFVSTAGDNISPGSIPRWRGNFGTEWKWHNLTTTLNLTYTASYQDDPLFVLSPKMQAFFDAHTPGTDPAFAAFLADVSQPKIGGYRRISSFMPVDLQCVYDFKGQRLLKGVSLTLGTNNLFDKLAPFAAGAFNDSYDTRTHNNIGRFVYANVRKEF
jgi:iron complex outermembrane receptor protein